MKRGAGCPGLAGALPLGASAADPTRHGGLLLGSGSSGKVCWKMADIRILTYVIYLEYVHDVDPMQKSGINGIFQPIKISHHHSPWNEHKTVLSEVCIIVV